MAYRVAVAMSLCVSYSPDSWVARYGYEGSSEGRLYLLSLYWCVGSGASCVAR